MNRRIRVEIKSRSDYWHKAVFVEWEHAFPERKLEPDGQGMYLIEADWLSDLQRIASQVFSTAVVSPEDPGRRRWFRLFVPDGR